MTTRRGGLVSAADSTMAKQKGIAICAAKQSTTAAPRGKNNTAREFRGCGGGGKKFAEWVAPAIDPGASVTLASGTLAPETSTTARITGDGIGLIWAKGEADFVEARAPNRASTVRQSQCRAS